MKSYLDEITPDDLKKEWKERCFVRFIIGITVGIVAAATASLIFIRYFTN